MRELLMGYPERLMMTYKPGQLIVMYEKATYVLSSNGPAIVLAKVDVDAEQNKERVGKYEVQGFPIIKILRNGGEKIQI
ncbi:hypothetical protein L1987_30040 [Smallanthus sonchifolius]|uniref:Uncharacterized protein n=1 Tax=Smallanthus sonchifolius TaxID=185202 RepID=A0ACB9I143_9ASTR|nr:hypothetical protein L1987_30040 [Smallanthus sonchifolius]